MKHLFAAMGLLVAIGIPAACFAQDSATARHDVFSATLNYQSRVDYFGRTDSLKSSILFPSLEFESRTGLYAQGNVIFLNNSQQTMEYAGTLLQAGYRFPESKHFSGNLYYNQILYRSDVDLLESAVKEQPGVNLTYKTKVVNLTLGADLKFSNRTDVGATGGLDHLWIIRLNSPKTALGIDPTANIYLGTQNFTESILEQKDLLGIPLGNTMLSHQVQQFSVLSYAFTMPVVFVKGKFNASLTPSYVLPQNLIEGETGYDMFYVSAAVGVRL